MYYKAITIYEFDLIKIHSMIQIEHNETKIYNNKSKHFNKIFSENQNLMLCISIGFAPVTNRMYNFHKHYSCEMRTDTTVIYTASVLRLLSGIKCKAHHIQHVSDAKPYIT